MSSHMPNMYIVMEATWMYKPKISYKTQSIIIKMYLASYTSNSYNMLNKEPWV